MPAAPVLFAAGVALHAGYGSVWVTLIPAIVAAVAGHTVWYAAGRYGGGAKVLRRVCQLALEPDACLRRTQDLFTRLGPVGLLLARFVPGLDTMAQPLAGMTGMSWSQYLMLNVTGATLWASTLIGAGYVFGPQLAQGLSPWTAVGEALLTLLAVAIVGWLIYKISMRYRALAAVRMRRLSPQELKERIDTGQPVVILDVRHPIDVRADPHKIPGAKLFSLDQVGLFAPTDIPAGSEVVIYCNCPNDHSAARVALALQARGIANARPLAGGLTAWERQSYPVENHPIVAPTADDRAGAAHRLLHRHGFHR